MFGFFDQILGFFDSFFGFIGAIVGMFVDLFSILFNIPIIVASFVTFMPPILNYGVFFSISLAIGLRLASIFVGSGKND